MELAIAEVVVEKLYALMVEKTSQEIALVRNFTRDLKWLKQLTSIHDFLAEANSRPVEHELVKTWLHRVREVAWDAEDIVEQYALHTSNNGEGGAQEARGKIISGSSVGNNRNSKHFETAPRISTSDIARSLSKHQSSSGARKENCLLLGDSEPVGIDSKVGELIKVIESSDVSVVVVVGIAGVGKTLLLKNVYNKIKGRIEERYDYSIWLSISQSYSVENLGRDLMSQIMGNTNNVSEGTVAEQIHDALQGKKSFVVLDDVWWRAGEENIIESLGLPIGPNSHCKVLVTTRDRRVHEIHAAAVAYNMKLLSEEDSWRLFCDHAFGVNRLPAAGLKGIAREVEKKCRRLPLALKIVGASLFGCTVKRLWKSKLYQLRGGSAMKNLKSIYDSLPPSLKVCFSYLSFFPEDERINAEYLINLWIAEGFIPQEEDQWDTAWGYLYQLADLCLLEVEEDEFLDKHCKIHDLLHDLAIDISREHQSKFSVDDHDFRSAKRILLPKKEIKNMPSVQSRASYPKSLRTLSLYQNPMEQIEEKFVSRVRLLRVLDLSRTGISTLPTCVGKLKLLKLFNLSGTKIKEVPECVRSLKSLRFLDLSHCKQLQSLPKWVNKLKSLQHLNIEGCGAELPSHMPREISELVALRVLRSWYLRLSVEEDGFLKLEDIAKLTCLQEVSLQVQDEMQLTVFRDWPPKMRHLSIKGTSPDQRQMTSFRDWPPTMLPNLSADMPDLQTLKLMYFAFPDWVCNLTDLVELSLEHCDCESYPELQVLPNLKKLLLDGNESCIKLPEALGKQSRFPKLRFLLIQRFPVLEELPDFENGAMAALEDFYIGFCPLVKKVPEGLMLLRKLKKFRYTGYKDDGLNKGPDFWNEIRASINDQRVSHLEIGVTIV